MLPIIDMSSRFPASNEPHSHRPHVERGREFIAIIGKTTTTLNNQHLRSPYSTIGCERILV